MGLELIRLPGLFGPWSVCRLWVLQHGLWEFPPPRVGGRPPTMSALHHRLTAPVGANLKGCRAWWRRSLGGGVVAFIRFIGLVGCWGLATGCGEPLSFFARKNGVQMLVGDTMFALFWRLFKITPTPLSCAASFPARSLPLTIFGKRLGLARMLLRHRTKYSAESNRQVQGLQWPLAFKQSGSKSSVLLITSSSVCDSLLGCSVTQQRGGGHTTRDFPT